MLNLPLLVSLFGLVAASGYQCRGPIELSPPAELSVPVNWPSIWNDSMPPIPFATQQNCLWEVAVPQGLFASVVFYRDAPSQIGIWVEYPNGHTEGIDNDDHSPYIFTSSNFRIHLGKSAIQGSFSFNVVWSKYPNTIHSTVQLVKAKGPITQRPNSYITTFTADTSVSLVAFSLKNSSEVPLLRQSAVYEGNSTNGRFLGTLHQVLMSNKAMVSNGNSVTVYTFGLVGFFDYPLLLAEDHSNDVDISFYKGLNCYSDSLCPMPINAISGSAAVATVDSRTEYIKSIDLLPKGSTLQVYEGGFGNETLIASLTNENYANQLPLAVQGSLKQYLLDSSLITVQLSRDPVDAKWNTVYDGRIVNIHSFDYGKNSYKQDTVDSFSTVKNQKLYFKFKVNNCDFNGNTTLSISIFRDGNTVFTETYSSQKQPPAFDLKIYGDKMTVNYQNYGRYSKGFGMGLTTTKN